ncbi:glycoside hydrolase [Raphidocelis subcapitata]|uniref:Glycoside hydrolase n=1 Tax=Raphidocelis subcapitata TaxID=307507 RepID=A0A2V0NRG4_9CHLO|nr:glycoside hydrolase [Raphidocelis subcapitata]|eukprot:GBF88153.1 glycoside hydrolase [Raphidocelis subcapitata]
MSAPSRWPRAPPRGSPPPRLRLDGPRIVDASSGQPVGLKAMNWFGLNTDQMAPDGLWAGGSDTATDFLEIVYQIKLLGFNAVRLPFRFQDLGKTAPDKTRRCKNSPEWVLKRRVTDPRLIPIQRQLPPRPFALQRQGGEGACNSYLPAGTGLDRLLWTMQVMNSHGLYVILDYHGSSGATLEMDSVATAERFASKWAEVWRAVACVPGFASDVAGRVVIDILNEPDMLKLTWGPLQPLKQPSPNWATLAIAAMDTLYAQTPGDVIFMISGTGQTKFGTNWGNGFVTNPATLAQYQLADPNPFFRELIRKPYVNRVVLGPHCYPPTITGLTFLGSTLWNQLTNSVGYLQTKGYCWDPDNPGAFAVRTAPPRRGGGAGAGTAGTMTAAAAPPRPPGAGAAAGGNATAPAPVGTAAGAQAPGGAGSSGSSSSGGSSGAASSGKAGAGALGSGVKPVKAAGRDGQGALHGHGEAHGSVKRAAKRHGDAEAAAEEGEEPGEHRRRRRARGAEEEEDGGSAAEASNEASPAAGPAPAAAAAAPAAAADTAAAAAPVDADALPAPQRRLLSDGDGDEVAAAGVQCVRFPIVIGEFGSFFEQPNDVQWMSDFATWLANQQSAVGAPIGWAFWAYNANSGDTGGIVNGNWQTLMWVKLRFLVDRMGLRPWYL